MMFVGFAWITNRLAGFSCSILRAYRVLYVHYVHPPCRLGSCFANRNWGQNLRMLQGSLASSREAQREIWINRKSKGERKLRLLLLLLLGIASIFQLHKLYVLLHCRFTSTSPLYPRTRFHMWTQLVKSTESSNYCTNYHLMIMKSGN